MAENDTPNPPANDAPNPPANDAPLPVVPPVVTPPAATATNANGDLAAVTTLLAALPEKVANAVRESIPATPTPPANDPPKTDPPKADPPANSGPNDEKPGNKSRVTFFGIPWS